MPDSNSFASWTATADLGTGGQVTYYSNTNGNSSYDEEIKTTLQPADGVLSDGTQYPIPGLVLAQKQESISVSLGLSTTRKHFGMIYLFALLIFEGVVCIVIQLNIVKLLRARFSQKWIEWGQPHPFSTNAKATITFVRLVMSNALVGLGDAEISKRVQWIRFAWLLFLLTFLGCLTVFLITNYVNGSVPHV